MCRPLTWIEKKSGPESPRQHSCQRNASPESNRRNAQVFTVKKLRLRIIYYLHGGKKICINVVELAQRDDDWQRNRTHWRGMRDYWEAALCFGKYLCFSSGRNKFELRGNRCSPVRFTLAAETSACLCTTVYSSAPKQQDDKFGIFFISPDSRDSDNVSGFLKWPQIYLSACCRPTLTPPVGLNRIPDALGCCCRATGSHLAHRFALQLAPLRLPCGPLTDLSALHG